MERERPRIGLALGAGGTKGTAHAGVLKVLEEARIPIGFIAGSSIGAAYAAAFSAGYPARQMEQDVLRASPRDVVSLFFHRLKLDPATPIGRRFYEELQGVSFADMRIPLAVVASDLFARGPVVLDSGDVLSAVQASLAVPLMAKPVRRKDGFFVDGGFWEPAPVTVVRGMGADKVVEVVLGESINLPRLLRPTIRRLIDRFDPLVRRHPDPPASALFLLFTLVEPPRVLMKADVTIRPDVIDISANSPFHLKVCLRRGEEAARRALPEIRRLFGNS